MNAGQLDRRITIQSRTVAIDDESRTEVVTWTDLETTWAQVQDVLPGRSEAARHGLQTATDQVRVRMRYRSDLNPGMRIVVLGDTNTILHIVGGPAEIGRRQWLEVLCERYVPSGGNDG